MTARRKLFRGLKLYDIPGSDGLFLRAMRESIAWHAARCPEYARLLERQGFEAGALRDISDIAAIPPLPTLFLKQHALFSVPQSKLMFRAESSGTRGVKSVVGLDFDTSWLDLLMVIRSSIFHRFLSPRLTNYIVLGYQPRKDNKLGVAQTAFGATLLAPALHRTYALRWDGDGYSVDLDGVIAALQRYERAGHSVRILGFPAYLLFLLEALDERGIRLKLHPASRIMTGGGWKQFFSEKADRSELYRRAERQLGIKDDHCHDYFGAVEHPVMYCDCRRHRFHVPRYSRIVIRDPLTLRPLPYGQPGLLNLISPLMSSMPLLSVITDDLAILHEPGSCGCGIDAPWFEVLGRAGLEQIKTCAAGAGELLREVKL